MAITGGDWSSSTDPFILALAHAYSSTVGEISFNRVKLLGSEGFINAIVNDKDVQEIYWSKDGDVEKSWPVNAFQTAGTGPAAGYPEFGGFDENLGSGFVSFAAQDLIEADPKTAYVFTTGKSGGAVLYSLFAFTAYAWEQKDPAQVLFSWIAHHVDSIWTLKDYINQTSFQDASDYYDENPCHLSLYREVGFSIDEQIKKVMDHTSDFLVIGPADTSGDVQLSLKTRRDGLTSRDAAIDLEGESVRAYTIRPTDRYTLDKVNASFGSVIMMAGGPLADQPEDYITSQPIEFPSENRNKSMQKVGDASSDRTVGIECPYHILRENLLSHLDIGFWKDDQDEIEIEFTDLSHFNFEAGDIVPVIGRGYDGTELFLVTEKTVDWDTMKATCRVLMLRGIDGKSAVYADEPNLLLNLRPNSLGLFFDGSVSLPVTMPLADDPRNFDRLWSEKEYSHPSQHTRGTVGPAAGPPGPWPLDANVRNGWPCFNLALETGLEISKDLTGGRESILTSAISDYTFYWVGNPTTITGYRALFESDDGGANNIIFAVSGSGTPGKVQYYDGTWRGSVDTIAGWQILVFALNSAAGSTIRRNGAQIEGSLTYTRRQMAVTDDYGLGVNAAGASGVFEGDWAECSLFQVAHDTATIESIEAHLAEKYNISI